MRITEEVGFFKVFKFALFSLVQPLFFIAFVPPIRSILISVLGAKIGRGSILMNVKFFNLHHRGFKGLVIGNDCFIGDETLIDLYDRVKLEDQVTLAQRVTVITHLNVGYRNHPLQGPFPKKSQPVIFKKGSVIGAASVILQGVTVGENSFVAAGSVVTKDVAPNSLVAGVPARVIRKINFRGQRIFGSV